MAHITANDLKTRGIAAIEASLSDGRTEAVVSVRGTERYVVMEVGHYQHLRECELEAALAESRAEIAAGRFVVESATEHMARLQAITAGDAAAPSARPTAAKKAAAGAKSVRKKAARKSSRSPGR